MTLRVVLAGQRSFGAAVLREVVEAGHKVELVVSPEPDGDRPDLMTAGARSTGLPWSPSFDVPFEADVIVAAHSHHFIGRRTRARTVLGGIGYHPSLLPLHRGRDAIRWTVRMGDPVAGGSVYWLTDTIDAGPIAAQDYCFVRPGDTASSLWKRELFPMGVRLVLETLADLEAGRVVADPQDERCATWEPSWERPPLFRPELPELGSMPAGYTLTRRRPG